MNDLRDLTAYQRRALLAAYDAQTAAFEADERGSSLASPTWRSQKAAHGATLALLLALRLDVLHYGTGAHTVAMGH